MMRSARPTRDFSVYACLLRGGAPKLSSLPSRAIEGVIASGTRVEVQVDNVWRHAVVVKPGKRALGTVVYLKIGSSLGQELER